MFGRESPKDWLIDEVRSLRERQLSPGRSQEVTGAHRKSREFWLDSRGDGLAAPTVGGLEEEGLGQGKVWLEL